MIDDIEPIFNRALKHSFSRKKLLFVFPILVLCGVLIVLCRALSVGAGSWVWVSLAFLPLFFCAGIMLAAAIPLIRAYHDEIKDRPLSYHKTLRSSWKLMVGASSFAVPLILAYLLLWIVLGLFYLLKGIPTLGHPLVVIFSFGPFLLILGCLVLSVISLLLIFFVTPQIALQSHVRWELAEEAYQRIKTNIFRNVGLLIVGLLPILVVVGCLILAAAMTGLTYFTAERPLAVAVQWFFIMIPFAALISPALIFFFNFAAESFALMQRKGK